MKQISDGLIYNVLSEYGVNSSGDLCSKVRAYAELLLRWNHKIALTAVTEPKEVLRRHFGESFFGAGAAQIEFGRLADVGSGAGFPGIALRLIRPDMKVVLIEASVKKSTFLREVVRELELTDVEVMAVRAEDVGSELRSVDFVTARAVGEHVWLLEWAQKRLLPRGKAVLWLGRSGARSVMLDHNWKWESPVLIPGSERRFIVVGAPIKASS